MAVGFLQLLAASLAWNSLLRPPVGGARRSAASAVILSEGVAQQTVEPPTTQAAEGVVVPAGPQAAEINPCVLINARIKKAKDDEAVLKLVDESDDFNAINMATALHRLAVMNKRQRARRDALLRDRRFQSLIDSTVERTSEFNSRGVADVLWSCATLQHWPSTLLVPVLTSVSAILDEDMCEAQHLSTMVWALARLECKPVRLLERIEVQAIPRLSSMNVQNCANLLWGFAKLNYRPAKLLPPLSTQLLKPEMLADAKPVEVADLAYALGMLGPSGEHTALLVALGARAAPEAILDAFSSRQVVTLIWAMTKLQATDELPEGLLDAWVAAVRTAHERTPLLATDARNLERTLLALGRDVEWIKRSEMLNAWSNLAEGAPSQRSRSYSDEELRATFESIDTDNSGDIDRGELTSAIKAINPEVDDAAVESMLAYGDKDGDYQVSFEEFKKIMLTPPSATPAGVTSDSE